MFIFSLKILDNDIDSRALSIILVPEVVKLTQRRSIISNQIQVITEYGQNTNEKHRCDNE